MVAHIDPTADVHKNAKVGESTTVWGLTHIREGASVGGECTIGRGVYIGPGASLGDGCKVQNHALVYEPARVEDGVFIGPAAVLTNDSYPRAITPEGKPKDAEDWTPVGVTVRHGASIGARTVCVAPVTIGRWAMVAAGSVVARDVPDFALVAGVPARRVRWVGRAGAPLEGAGDGHFVCPRTGERYTETDGTLRPDDPHLS
ncbi:acyltransferase [Streptomyces sp. RTd22]|uniref:acyltransferase n=1 Tax=Streptomyces sp. RTd22 TaxID=1841249 RepID=UPI0007C485E7|nr:acyltransferase [Streptomyces sp. RTd22]